MAYSPNYAPGDILTAAAMNSIGEAWTSFTPTWTAAITNPAIGNGTRSGKYVKLNKLIVYRASISAGSTTTFGTGVWRVDLPVTAASAYAAADPIGFGWVNDGFTLFPCHVTLVTTSTVQLNYVGTVLGSNILVGVDGTAPFNFGSGDGLRFEVIYEAA